jgi:hypothetical protein
MGLAEARSRPPAFFIRELCNRRARPVKALMRGFGVASLAICFAVLSGCGTDNESEALKAQDKLGAAPTPAAKSSGGEARPSPSSAADRRPPEVSPELKNLGRKK